MITEDKNISVREVQGIVRTYVVWTTSLFKHSSYSRTKDKEILQSLGLIEKPKVMNNIKKCIFLPPMRGQIKANTDKSIRGNPATSDLGISFLRP